MVLSKDRVIIGISGKARAGKDTLAEGLIKRRGFTKVSFADPLKDILSRTFEIDKDIFYDERKDAPFPHPVVITKTNICFFIDNVIDIVGEQYRPNDIDLICRFEGVSFKTPREMMQIMGTEVARNNIDENVWLVCFRQSIGEGKYVCSDVRMKNERELIKSMGGELILIERPSLNSNHDHISENDLGDKDDYDVFVINDQTPEYLANSIVFWYDYVRAKRNEWRNYESKYYKSRS